MSMPGQGAESQHREPMIAETDDQHDTVPAEAWTSPMMASPVARGTADPAVHRRDAATM